MVKLFCFPHAGGSASFFSKWKKEISEEIELCPVELSGRGIRFSDALYDNMNEMIEDVYNTIIDKLDGEYAFFGHSMGSLIAYELAHKVLESGYTGPSHMFLSGYAAPHVPRNCDRVDLLPELEFKNSVMSLGGTPKEVAEHKELWELVSPIIRADYRLIHLYKYIEKPNILNCNLTMINGKEDKISMSDILEWNKCTKGKSSVYMMDGGHFYISECYHEVIKIINHTLTSNH